MFHRPGVSGTRMVIGGTVIQLKNSVVKSSAPENSYEGNFPKTLTGGNHLGGERLVLWNLETRRKILQE